MISLSSAVASKVLTKRATVNSTFIVRSIGSNVSSTSSILGCQGKDLSVRSTVIRTHMNHGGTFMGASPSQHGPRQPLQLGLDVAKASQNVLRLLESSHGIQNYSSSQYQDTSNPCWHDAIGLRWTCNDKMEWTAHRPGVSDAIAIDDDDNDNDNNNIASSSHFHSHSSMDWIPTVSWLQFSDDRTALAKLQAMDGSQRYISLLRLDQDGSYSSSMALGANDGWVIVREVSSRPTPNPKSNTTDMTSLILCLQHYLNIEHGGGEADYQMAKNVIFAPQASLLTVGMDKPNQPPSDWSAPVGTVLEIPLSTYLEGVQTQKSHPLESRKFDAIVQMDRSGEAAAATVKVGNGAQTLVFVDHLLLGETSEGWKILSKTFSPQLWEDDDVKV